jgi:hypothetical protein
VRGIPNEEQRRALSPFFTPELRELMARAERHRASLDSKRGRRGKSSCEGDLFTSNTAGYADTYAMGFPHPAIGRLILPIHLAEEETGDAWVDQLILHHENGRWFIADIIFSDDRRNRLFGKRDLLRVLKGCLRY